MTRLEPTTQRLPDYAFSSKSGFDMYLKESIMLAKN